MKLISSPTSPFVRTVRVLIRETGQDVDEAPVATSPMATDPSVLTGNPLGKIPALIREEGPALYDSRVICRYLDHRAGTDMYPETRLWETLTLEATAQGIMDSAVSCAYERRVRPEEFQFDGWIEAQWTKVSRALDAIEERWMSHLLGPLDAAHIATGCALGYLDFRFGDRNWRKGRPNLAAWFEAFNTRPSMKETEPEG